MKFHLFRTQLGLNVRISKSATLILALIALGGCASTDDDAAPEWAGVKNEDAPAKLVDFTETAKFEVRWESHVGNSGANQLHPVVTENAVYAVSARGGLSSLDRNTGKLSWRIESGINVSGGIGGGDGLLIIGGSKGEVLAYDESGKQIWKAIVSSEALSVSQSFEGIVLVRSGDGRITGLNVTDGTRAWLFERSTPALVVRSHAGAAIYRGVAFVGFAGGRLAAIKVKNGEVLWETAVSQARGNTELERISDITASPVVDDEQVCAIAFQGRMACYDLTQGGPLWNRDISSDKGMKLLRRYLYLTDAKSSVIEMDKATGNTVWKNDQLFMRGVSTPYVTDDFVVVGDRKGYLHGLSREDGSLMARIDLEDGAISATMLQLDDGILVQTSSGGVYSLSINRRK